MRVPALSLALSLLVAPAAFATEMPAPTAPPATEAPALPVKQVNTAPAQAEAQQVRTEAMEVNTTRQRVSGNIFYLIGVAVVILAVAALLLN